MSKSKLTPIEILKKYWGYTEFRDLQEDIISSILEGRDTLGLMPTGGGKSITFQVPTMALPGLAVVITPIISLMKDQVDNLLRIGIKATYLHAGLSAGEMRKSIDKCILGGCKFLYVSPERLGSERFMEALRAMDVSLIVVDEAHCISQWGYDFRPSFLHIADIRKQMPRVPILALTATATPEVVVDIMDKLEFREKNVFSKSFARDNLSYIVRNNEDKINELIHILQSVPGSGIVYVRSRKKTKMISDELNSRNIPSDFYHAGLASEDKEAKQNKWKSGETRIIVATNAFGMGIDKPDVRVVVHIDVPNSLEEYYQEAGRAGRDGKHSYVVLLTSKMDKAMLKKRITDSFPSRDFIKQVYELVGAFLDVAVGYGYGVVYDFNFGLFCKRFNLPVLATHSALKILTNAGYIEFIDEVDTQSRVIILANKEDLYHLSSSENPNLDIVLQALLRTYPGLFADYVFINEKVISERFLISESDIYDALLVLTKKHILHYVPRKRTPYVIFTTSREEKQYVKIPLKVYDELKARMEKRIGSMIAYGFSEGLCREQMLLNYFGEQRSETCGHCDSCRAAKSRRNHSDKDVQDGILYMAQVKPRRIEEFLSTLSFPKDEIIAMLSFLVDEGFIEHLPDDTYKNPIPLK